MNIKLRIGKLIYDYLKRQGMMVMTENEKTRIDAKLKDYEDEILELRKLAQHSPNCTMVRFTDHGSIHYKCDCGYRKYFNMHERH